MAIPKGFVRPVAGMAVLAWALLVWAVLVPPAAAGLPATATAAAKPVTALPRLPAPLGLSFGMRPEEVTLPVVVAPAPLAAATQPRQLAPSVSAPVVLGPRTAAPVQQATEGGLGEYVRVCEAAFDRVSALAAGDREWLAWRAEHLQGGEGSDFTEDLADRAGLAVAPGPALAGAADGWRSAGLYRFDGTDGRRLVCLLFTADGLAQVFLAGHALDGLRDGVIAHLERQGRLEGFALIREARRFSLSLRRPACGLYCRLFGERMLVERRLWLDPRTRILVAAKRGLVASGLAGAITGGGLQSEVFDGLPDSFLASIDVGRRAFVLRQPSAGGAGAGPAARAAGTFAPAPAGTSRKALVESFVP